MANLSSKAANRIIKLLDPASFAEIGASMTARSTDFCANPSKEENDGVITGHGLIDGNLVYVYSQDDSVLGGTMGEMHAKKICALYDMAAKVGAPVIGLLDSKGIRLMESIDAAESLAGLIAKIASASGVVPTISAVFGQLGGGMAAMASLSDFTFMEENAHLFVTPPNAIEGVNKDKFDPSSAAAQFANTGVVDAIGSEDEILAKIRELVTLIPGSSLEEGRMEPPVDDMNRLLDAGIKNADTETFVSALADNGMVLEYKAGRGKGIFAGLIKLGGRTVGVIANNRKDGKSGHICGACTNKAARFIKFLDAFDIPILTITDVCGYKNNLEAEYGLQLSLAMLASSLVNADVAKINLLRNGQSSAYLFMNSKSLSADIVYSYEDSKLEIMDADKLSAEIASGTDESADEIKSRLKAEIFGAKNAARRGYVDSIIDFSESRKYLIAGFEMLATKTGLPYKKHSAK